MSNILAIFEDKKFPNFFPLSLSQPVFDLRVGCGTLRGRLAEAFPGAAVLLLCRDYVADIVKLHADAEVNESPKGPAVFVNGRLLCMRDELEKLFARVGDDTIAFKGGYVVAARLSAAPAVEFATYLRRRVSDDAIAQVCAALKEHAEHAGVEPERAKRRSKATVRSSKAALGTYEDAHAIGQDSLEEQVPLDLTSFMEGRGIRRVELPEARLLSFPWQLIEFNADVIADDFLRLPFRGPSEDCVIYPAAQLVDEENIVIGVKAVIRPGAVLDATDGPIVLGDRTVVMPNASLVGPVAVGPDCVVRTGAKILGGTSIGGVCKIGGEVEGTIFAAYSNKQHDGFIGHSYIGEWVNIGAASNNSDLKNNYSAVRMWCAGTMHETGRQFLGLLMGDHTKTGINTLFNTGTVVGFNCNVYSSETPAKFVPSFSWGHGEEMLPYDLDKAVQTAAIVMERRRVKFTAAHRRVFKTIFEISERCARNV